MDQVWSGVDRLIDGYARVRPADLVLVPYTPDSREPASWVVSTLRARGVATTPLAMRALEDVSFPSRLEAALPAPSELDGRKLVIISLERDTMSHTEVFREALRRYAPEQWLTIRMISASTEFFTHAMQADAAELSARNVAVLERLMSAGELRVTSPGGTDLRVTLKPEQYKWLSNRGAYRPGGMIVLPPGEVATFPESVDGVLVADGAFNINVFTRLDARLGRAPISVTIERGRAVHFSCDDAKLSEMLRLCFDRPNARRVGEVGFGTNWAIPTWIPLNSHINERRPGLHIGFGQHNQSVYVVDYRCDIHMDLITDGGLVWADGDASPLDLKQVLPSPNAHPSLVMDEDIDGDCCGLWLEDLRAGVCVPRSAPSPASAD